MATFKQASSHSTDDLKGFLTTIENLMKDSDTVIRKKQDRINILYLNDTQQATVNSELTADQSEVLCQMDSFEGLNDSKLPLNQDKNRIFRRQERILNSVKSQNIPFKQLVTDATQSDISSTPSKMDKYAQQQQKKLQALIKEADDKQMQSMRPVPKISQLSRDMVDVQPIHLRYKQILEQKQKKINQLAQIHAKPDLDEIELQKQPNFYPESAEILNQRLEQRELTHKKKWDKHKKQLVQESQAKEHTYHPQTNKYSNTIIEKKRSMVMNSQPDPVINLYSTSLHQNSEQKQPMPNPMLAIQQMLETAEANKIKAEQHKEARFNHQHPFKPEIKSIPQYLLNRSQISNGENNSLAQQIKYQHLIQKAPKSSFNTQLKTKEAEILVHLTPIDSIEMSVYQSQQQTNEESTEVLGLNKASENQIRSLLNHMQKEWNL